MRHKASRGPIHDAVLTHRSGGDPFRVVLDLDPLARAFRESIRR